MIGQLLFLLQASKCTPTVAQGRFTIGIPGTRGGFDPQRTFEA